jgi:hypothetical protein
MNGHLTRYLHPIQLVPFLVLIVYLSTVSAGHQCRNGSECGLIVAGKIILEMAALALFSIVCAGISFLKRVRSLSPVAIRLRIAAFLGAAVFVFIFMKSA